jgi:hypothetical protein
MTKPHPHALAIAFAKEIHEDLSESQLEEARRRNDAEEMDGVCHTHDFADTNMTMDRAFTEVVGRETIIDEDNPEQSEADALLWSKAWAIAQKSRFDLPTLMAETPKAALMGMSQDDLTEVMAAYLEKQGLPEGSAEEILFSVDLNPDQRDWIETLCEAWQAVEDTKPQSVVPR